MAELRLWGLHHFRPDLLRLPAEERLFLIDAAVMSADCCTGNLPDGFIADDALLGVPCSSPESAATYLRSFEERGWVTRVDDPAGWQFEGWLTKVRRHVPGDPETKPLAWGQLPWEKLNATRTRGREASKNYRRRRSPSAEGETNL